MNPKHINQIFENLIEFFKTQNWLILVILLITVPALITYFLGLVNDKINKNYNLKDTLIAKIFKTIWLPFLFFL